MSILLIKCWYRGRCRYLRSAARCPLVPDLPGVRAHPCVVDARGRVRGSCGGRSGRGGL